MLPKEADPALLHPEDPALHADCHTSGTSRFEWNVRGIA